MQNVILNAMSAMLEMDLVYSANLDTLSILSASAKKHSAATRTVYPKQAQPATLSPAHA